MSSLPTALRRQLENTIQQARTIATRGARKALQALAVHEPEPYDRDETRCDQRRKLRAQARQLGDQESQTRRGAYGIEHLAEKLAYDQWHRVLFARFLLESNLLISPDPGVSVTLDDCEELAPSFGLKDAWSVAARFAAKELPEIFRADDPAGAVELPVEDRKPLIQLVTGLPVEVFTASDSLGWCYQFWQAERKDQVNAAGNKIGADELPCVTQLFTEDYMVDFLLDNTLGAWHAGKAFAADPKLAENAESEEELRSAVSLPGVPWKYLRFLKGEDGKWTSAAGTFAGWPKAAKELRCLDPCMGSGHFVVAMFERLAALRMAEEKLDEPAAVAAVMRDNLFGLEIDPRCTQLGAFNLALAAWRRLGHCRLPAMNLACSGLAPNTSESDWLEIAGDDYKLQNGMARLYRLFKDAPLLGSLINPRATGGDLLEAGFHELQPLLEEALVHEMNDDTAREMTVTARGLAKAAEILAGKFTLVATNVPYLGDRKQHDLLRIYCESAYSEARADLATCFMERCLAFCVPNGSTALVTPQNWLFHGSSRKLREQLLRKRTWTAVAQLGEEAWWSFGIRGPRTILLILSEMEPRSSNRFVGFDVSTWRGQTPILIEGKIAKLCGREPLAIQSLLQADQLKNPDARLVFEASEVVSRLTDISQCLAGIQNGDSPVYLRCFWELLHPGKRWGFQQTAPSGREAYGGMDTLIDYDMDEGHLRADSSWRRGALHDSDQRGKPFWGKRGVLVSRMSSLPCSLYLGSLYDQASGVIVPNNANDLAAIWAFCSAAQYNEEVRKLDQKVNVTSATLAKVSFDLAHWQKVAAEKYPHGLPKPFSSDPTQWLFNGQPKGADQPLHVAVARLLGYQWPRQTGSSFPDCPALGADGLEELADSDGIVCLSATKSEAPAAERLRGLLVQALGKLDLNALIASAGPQGCKSETLEDWLRDEFFEQHCALFQHRPFIWHIWDGQKNGFSALVNYHKLTYGNLETLTYAYLGDWIRRQQSAVDSGESGSDARLQAAKQLQIRLKLILEGEPPYDIFVRWKPLSEQAVGWHPDINDGVRVNIRPFAIADILRKRVKIKWEKDRGKEPWRDKKDFPWFWGWDEKQLDFVGAGDAPDGNRWNDCHYTNEFRKRAREENRPR
jgi:hypothetical protein